jgi:hypothetical protein
MLDVCMEHFAKSFIYKSKVEKEPHLASPGRKKQIHILYITVEYRIMYGYKIYDKNAGYLKYFGKTLIYKSKRKKTALPDDP